NAFLLDHVDVDIELLTRLNNVIADGKKAYGDGFAETLSDHARARGAPPYKYVANLTVRPSEDIGRLAGDFVSKGKFIGDPLGTKRLFTILELGAGTEADLASYLLFDGRFCRQLVEMGRADARARRDDLMAFFGEAGDDEGGGAEIRDDGPSGKWEK